MSKNFLIDKNSMQIFGHFEKLIYNGYGTKIEPNPNFQKRLRKFLRKIEQNSSGTINKVIVDYVTEETLQNIDCLVSLTRIRPYEPDEIDFILNYLQKPTSRLLLMSNHSPDQLYDDIFAPKIEMSLTGGYWSGKPGKYIEISSEYLSDHEIVRGNEDYEKISTLVTNTTCRVVSTYGQPILYLPDNVEGRWSSLNEKPIKMKVFALAVDGKVHQNDYIKGKGIIIGDSGFIGDEGSVFPGYGLIEQGDNIKFLRNVIKWLFT